jgi:hypothetical protein
MQKVIMLIRIASNGPVLSLQDALMVFRCMGSLTQVTISPA